MRIARLVLLTFVSVLLFARVDTQAETNGEDHFTVGVIAPFSGSSANFGTIARNGIELAVRALQAPDRERIRVVYEDDGLVAARTVTAARKLIDVDKVDALITWSSSSGLAVSGITESKRIPHISIASDPAVTRGKTFSFTFWPDPRGEAELLYEHLIRSGAKRVAVLTLTHNGTLAMRDAFVEVAGRRGGVAIVSSEEVAADVNDFRGVLTRMKRRGDVDGFLPIFFPGQLAQSIKQAREIGIAAALFGFETFEDKDDFVAANGLLAGGVYVTGADPTEEFLSRYKAAYPGVSHYTASHAHDAFRLLVDGWRQGHDSAAIIAFLRGLRDYPTASGLASATGDNRFRLPCVVKRLNAAGEGVNVAGAGG